MDQQQVMWLDGLNNNKILWGVSMLLLNTGSKTVLADLPKAYDWLLTHAPAAKYVIIFSMFFVATHDILTSFCLTILYILLVDGILHQDRKSCLLPKAWYGKNDSSLNQRYYESLRILNTKNYD
jgi:hypothetical protein